MAPRGLWLWVLLLLTVGVGGSTSPLLTIQSPDGDIVDCIAIEAQRAFQHPMLKNHKLQEPPTVPDMVTKEPGVEWQVWHKNGTQCPTGSVPVRRAGTDKTPNPIDGDKVTKGHEYVVGSMEHRPKIYGTQVTMNVWQPLIQSFGEFSLGQLWLTSGSYKTDDLNSIEAGWQVYPGKYGDLQPRFFIFWTTDAYNNTRCYNLECDGGFVQTSRNILVGGAINRTSIFGGFQIDLTIRIWKDQKLGSWWLGVIFNTSVFEPVGYWPAVLFTIQTDYAEKVEWGGEIVNMNISGRHTTTQMGAGSFPNSGVGKVAYMRDLQIALAENDFQPLKDLMILETHPHFYRGKKLNDTCFSYGGPTQLESNADRHMIDYAIMYFAFCLLFIF